MRDGRKPIRFLKGGFLLKEKRREQRNGKSNSAM